MFCRVRQFAIIALPFLCTTGMLKTRDETIRSSHDTIRIDTKGDDMVIFDTIRYGQ